MSRVAKLINIGERVGVVTVVGRVYNGARKEWEYMCECRCGNRFKSRRDHLLKPREGCKACINRVNGEKRKNKRVGGNFLEKVEKGVING